MGAKARGKKAARESKPRPIGSNARSGAPGRRRSRGTCCLPWNRRRSGTSERPCCPAATRGSGAQGHGGGWGNDPTTVRRRRNALGPLAHLQGRDDHRSHVPGHIVARVVRARDRARGGENRKQRQQAHHSRRKRRGKVERAVGNVVEESISDSCVCRSHLLSHSICALICGGRGSGWRLT